MRRYGILSLYVYNYYFLFVYILFYVVKESRKREGGRRRRRRSLRTKEVGAQVAGKGGGLSGGLYQIYLSCVLRDVFIQWFDTSG